jgi:periplasmic protein TonB
LKIIPYTNQNIMKQKSLFTVLIVGLALASCNNNDTNDEATDTIVTDTSSSVMNVDPMTTVPDTSARVIVADTSTTSAGSVAANTNIGIAKPNPAKKGLKGKVSVTEPPAKKGGTMEADNTGVYSNVEVIPSFPGGYKGLQDYFDKNLAYPEDASSEGVEGTVNVSFVVDETGKLSSPQVVGEKLGYGLEAEALRVVNKMPTWTPGKLKGKNVKTRFNLPVRFQLY